MIIKQIKYNSQEYKEAVDLRNLILRQPLGLTLDQDGLLKEKFDIHLGCFENNKIIGTLVLTPINKTAIKIRQLAVAEKSQGRGIGRALMEHAEKLAAERKFFKIFINARSVVLDFYLKLGYKNVGDEYISDITKLPQYKMVKRVI